MLQAETFGSSLDCWMAVSRIYSTSNICQTFVMRLAHVYKKKYIVYHMK